MEARNKTNVCAASAAALTRKNWFGHTFTIIGRAKSQTSTSNENRLTTLPRGVMSKNDRGRRITLYSIRRCILPDAKVVPTKVHMARVIALNAGKGTI